MFSQCRELCGGSVFQMPADVSVFDDPILRHTFESYWTTPQSSAADRMRQLVLDLLGYSPSEAMVCATRYGGEIMGLGDELGQVKEGFIADLLLVNGDPLKDLDMMVHEKNLIVIMKDGELYKDQSASVASQRQAA